MFKPGRFVFAVFFIFFLSLSAYAELKIATYNIRNFDYDSRYNIRTDKNHLGSLLQQIDADVIGVQEIVYKDRFAHFIKSNFPQYEVALTQCGGAHNQSVGFIYNKNKIKLSGFYEDLRLSQTSEHQQPSCNRGSRPAAIASFQYIETGLNFVAISLHLKSGSGPSNHAKRHFQHAMIQTIINEFRQNGYESFAVMGDLNTTDFLSGNHNFRKFVEFLTQAGLTDMTASLGCSAYWWGGNPGSSTHKPSLLDHILLAGSLVQNIRTYQVEQYSHCRQVQCREATPDNLGNSYARVSDHCPLSVSLF